ncbi:MAG: hypothetical protein PHE55_06965 [Methylococcaceae bacterium]|nr:hypothetical protein [Methylococcaceae bacterium]
MFYSLSKKSLMLFLPALLLNSSLATAASFRTSAPNQFELQGGNVHVTYSTTGFDGKPHFSYQDSKQTLNFSGDQIRTVGTEVGTLVSVTTLMTIDSGSTTFTVLIPRINLDATLQAPIRTEGISTRHKFSVIPGLFKADQIDTYNFTILKGTASLVDF